MEKSSIIEQLKLYRNLSDDYDSANNCEYFQSFDE